MIYKAFPRVPGLETIDGYVVLDCRRAGNCNIVLGHRPGTFLAWATFQCPSSSFESYESGNFFTARRAAKIDFWQRAFWAWWDHKKEDDFYG